MHKIMNTYLSNLTRKQLLIIGVSGVIVSILLAVLVSMFGGLLKGQVNTPPKTYTVVGDLKPELLQSAGSYTLEFNAKNSSGLSADASSTFSISQ